MREGHGGGEIPPREKRKASFIIKQVEPLPSATASKASHSMETIMGFLDNVGSELKGVIGKVQSAAVPELISTALAKTNLGDLQGLVAKLQQGGLKDQVQSWLSRKP